MINKEYFIKYKDLYSALRIVKRILLFIPRSVKVLLTERGGIKVLGFTSWAKLMLYKIILIVADGGLRQKITDKKHSVIKNFLGLNYDIVVQNEVPTPEGNAYNQCIWICWLQGEAEAPLMVKKNINQIRRNANGHQVILITLDNFSRYVDIPHNLIQKFKNKMLLPAHLSDYIRYQLLYRYGGVWLDSTLFLTQPIGRDGEFNYDFYSAHFRTPLDDNCIARCRWVTPLIFCKKGNGFIYNVYRIFEKYHLEYDYCIDYLLIDYIMDYIISKDSFYANQINSVPYNNDDFQLFYQCLNKPFNMEKLYSIMNSQTYFYKLTYKGNYLTTVNGRDTFYKHFMMNY